MTKPLQWAWKASLVLVVLGILVANAAYVAFLSANNKPYATVGIPGEPGRDGYSVTGPEGPSGKNGANGINGQNGADGKNGSEGVNGINGLPGVNGSNGTNGINGRTPEIRCKDSTIQWRYVDEAVWHDLAIAECTDMIMAGD